VNSSTITGGGTVETDRGIKARSTITNSGRNRTGVFYAAIEFKRLNRKTSHVDVRRFTLWHTVCWQPWVLADLAPQDFAH